MFYYRVLIFWIFQIFIGKAQPTFGWAWALGPAWPALGNALACMYMCAHVGVYAKCFKKEFIKIQQRQIFLIYGIAL